MRPRRLTVLALSLLAAVTVSALWARSYRRDGEALLLVDRRPHPRAARPGEPVWHQFSLCSYEGRVGLERRAYEYEQFLRGGGYARDRLFFNMYGPTPWERRAGFSVYTAVRYDQAVGPEGIIVSETVIRGATAPHWAVLGLCVTPAAWVVSRTAWERRRALGRGFSVAQAPVPN